MFEGTNSVFDHWAVPSNISYDEATGSPDVRRVVLVLGRISILNI